MERPRRGAEGGAEGPGAASGTGHTQYEVTDLPAKVTLPHNQGRKVDGTSVAIYPQSRYGLVRPAAMPTTANNNRD